MARARQQMSVQLFPFLAVLVCVMGSLILLLLVTTRRLRTVAVAKARAALVSAVDDRPILAELVADEEPLPLDHAGTALAPAWTAAIPTRSRLTDPSEREWRRRVEELTEARDARTQALGRQRLLSTATQRQIDELKVELRTLQTAAGQLTGQVSAANLQPASGLRERVQLEEKIATLRQRLKQLEDQQRDNEGKFAIVPFDGKSGTTRRPILIECTASGLRFVAEDITLKPSDIAGFSENYNPLLAGSTALVNYWKQWNVDHAQDEASAEPYVLLLVRPSGTVAYYVAMRLLSPMKQAHGYELIAEDLSVAVPAAEPGAQAACRTAIERTLAERQQVVNAVRGARGGAMNGSPRPVAKPQPTAPKGEFQFDDLGEQPHAVGSRSWESPESFAGQEFRRGKPPGEPTPASEPPAVLPQVSDTEAAPVPAPATRNASRPPAEPSSGPQLLPDVDEQRPPTFAQSRKKSGQSRELPYEQLQRRRWGPHDPGASIGVEKTVIVRVDANRIVVGDETAITVPLGASRTDVFDRLLTVIDRQAQGWGKPGAGFFWIPSLKFVISPGGNQTYERLVPLITKCGLSSSAEFTLEQMQLPRSGGPS